MHASLTASTSDMKQVGDAIEITFLNRASRPYTIHAHGVRYIEPMEGALHAFDAASGANVLPGAQYIYKVSCVATDTVDFISL